MALLDGGIPSLQEIMAQQRRQAVFSGMTQAGLSMLGGAPIGQALGSGLAQMTPDPMDALNTYAAYQGIQDSELERTQAAEQRAAQEAYLNGPTQFAGEGLGGASGGMFSSGISSQERALAEAMGPDAYFAGKAKQHFAAPKDPLIKSFDVGDQKITRRYNRGTGEWEDMEKAPRYKPGTTVDMGGVVGELGSMMTKAGASKRAIDLEDRRVAVTQMAAQGANLIRNLNEAGDGAVSLTGSTARGLSKISSQGRALAKEVGFDLNLEKFEFGGDLSAKSTVVKSQLLGLAVALTKADQGSRPSDFDVQTSLNRLAANSGSSRTMARTIKSMLDEKMNDFAIDYRVRTQTPDLPEGKPFDWNSELTRHGIAFPDIPQVAPPAPAFTRDQLEREMQRRGLVPGG